MALNGIRFILPLTKKMEKTQLGEQHVVLVDWVAQLGGEAGELAQVDGATKVEVGVDRLEAKNPLFGFVENGALMEAIVAVA
jgi:hypothetical protein